MRSRRDTGVRARGLLVAAGLFSIGVAAAVTSGGTAHAGIIHAYDFASPGTVFDPVETPGAVPEPAAWTLMIAGLGLTGAALRRRGAVSAA